jgi:hypothetical protein
MWWVFSLRRSALAHFIRSRGGASRIFPGVCTAYYTKILLLLENNDGYGE